MLVSIGRSRYKPQFGTKNAKISGLNLGISHDKDQELIKLLFSNHLKLTDICDFLIFRNKLWPVYIYGKIKSHKSIQRYMDHLTKITSPKCSFTGKYYFNNIFI